MQPADDSGLARAGLERRAAGGLQAGDGGSDGPATASAPGRCTLVGDHVDYAGGRVLCVAIDLYVAVAIRDTVRGTDCVVSHEGRFERDGPPRAAGGGYVFAAAEALRHRRHRVPPFEAATAATLPAAAGLASSAAVICATPVALLRLGGERVPATTLVDLAYEAEHDVLGVPSGRLDQHAIVESPDCGAILLDCAADRASQVPWALTGAVLCVCDTGERHTVAGAGYRQRREETEAALRDAGAANAQQIADAVAGPLTAFDAFDRGEGDVPARRLRHVVTETRRATAAADALRAGDAALLGALMSASHRSLRDDQEVSTPLLDKVVGAAESVDGCYGARLVGAGFGGSVVALTTASSAQDCADVMRRAAGEGARAWVVHPSPGLALTAGDAVTRG